MKPAVDILYEQYYFQNALEQEKDPILSNYRAILRRELTKRQRKFLLQFEDRFGLLLEQQNREYFAEGLRLGMSLGALADDVEESF